MPHVRPVSAEADLFGFYHRSAQRHVTILRDGRLKQKQPYLHVENAAVLLLGDDESIDITAKQYKAMVQLVRVALHHNPCVQIVFNGGASPWGLDYFPSYETWMTIREAMRLRLTRIRSNPTR